MTYTTKSVADRAATSKTSWRRRGILPAVALLAMGLSAGPALADIGFVSAKSVTQSHIDVSSNSSAYTTTVIPLVSLSAQLQVALDAGLFGNVKSWKAWVKVKRENGFWVQFSNDEYSKSYAVANRPKTVDTVVNIDVPFGTIEPYAVANCNFLADTLRGQGLSNAEIFAQDRIIPIEVGGALSWEMTGAAGDDGTPPEVEGAYVPPLFNLVCKASPPVDLDPQAPAITAAALNVETNQTINFRDSCQLQLFGTIDSKDPNTEVKFRYYDDSGQQSDLKTVTTNGIGRAVFQHNYPISSQPKTGKIHIIGSSHAFMSNWADYEVTCSAPPSGKKADTSPTTSGVAEGAADGILPSDNTDTNLPNRPALGKTANPGTTRPGGPGAKAANLGQPDLMATTLGMSIAGGVNPWGSTVVISNPAHASAIGIGPNGNLCRFNPVAFRPFNKGTVASGVFKMAVLRNNSQVHTANFNIEPKTGLPANSGWHEFNLDLAQGMNVIKVVMDDNQTVAESDEGNNEYTLRVRVNFPCTTAQLKAPTHNVAPTSRTPGTTPPPEPGNTIIVPLPNLKTR